LNISNFIQELKRRNVFKVAVAYAIAGWLIIQVFDTIAPQLGFPEWIAPLVTILVLIGFPIAAIIAWAFELTPEGIQKSEDVEITESVTASTGKKLNGIIITVLSVAIVFLLVDRFFFASNVQDISDKLVSKISSQSVAVLPFADLSENKDQDWFSDGLTEEILNSLAQLPELQVTSRTSAFQFKGKDLDISLIADTLGVANVVEGSVRRIGDQLRVTAQLIRADDGFHLWSETYDSNTENLFDVQTDIAEEIATTLDIYLDEEKRERLFSSGTRNVEAFEEYLKGRRLSSDFHNNSIVPAIWEANKHYRKAMELDPEFGEPALLHMDAYAHILVEGQVLDESVTLEDAQQQILADQRFAFENVEDPVKKIGAELTMVLFSDSWYRMPILMKELKETMQRESIIQYSRGNNWVTEVVSIMGEWDLRGADDLFEVQNNPLSLVAWNYYASYKYKVDGLDGFRETMNDARSHMGRNLVMDKFEDVMLALDNEVEILKERYPDGVDPNRSSILFLNAIDAFVAAEIGQDEVATELLQKIEESMRFLDTFGVLTLYKLGRVDEAKALVAKLDNQPGGPANFALDIILYGNILFFDLEDAPNTAARFREAEIEISQFKKMPWVD